MSLQSILILGDVILDHYLVVRKEDSIKNNYPSYEVEDEFEKFGGAKNIFESISQFSEYLGFDYDYIGPYSMFSALMPLPRKTRYISFEPFQIHFKVSLPYDPKIWFTEEIEEETISKILDRQYDIGIISDSGYGNVTPSIISAARQVCKTLLIDPRGNDFKKYNQADFIFPNQYELENLLSFYGLDPDLSLDDKLEFIRPYLQGEQTIICKLGKMGSYVYSPKIKRRLYPRVVSEFCERQVVDTTSAGNAYLSTFAVSYLYEKDILLAAKKANMMATISVTEPLTFVPSKEQIMQVWNFDY